MIEVGVWDEAPLPVEPPAPADDEPVTVTRTVGVDAVLVKEGAAA